MNSLIYELIDVYCEDNVTMINVTL